MCRLMSWVEIRQDSSKVLKPRAVDSAADVIVFVFPHPSGGGSIVRHLVKIPEPAQVPQMSVLRKKKACIRLKDIFSCPGNISV